METIYEFDMKKIIGTIQNLVLVNAARKAFAIHDLLTANTEGRALAIKIYLRYVVLYL